MKALFFLLVFLVATGPPANAQQSPPTLTIIPTGFPDDVFKEAYIELGGAKHFHVLLTNNSDYSIKLFQEWNSWGYYGLSFEITYPDGRRVVSAKGPRGWDKNFPSTITVAPHGHHVFEVNFFNNPTVIPFWQHSVLNEPLTKDGLPCRIRAIYSIEPSKASDEQQVWTGTISSQENAYVIWH